MLVMNGHGEFVDVEVRPWEVTVPEVRGLHHAARPTCKVCGRELTGKRVSYCSDECKRKAERLRSAARSARTWK